MSQPEIRTDVTPLVLSAFSFLLHVTAYFQCWETDVVSIVYDWPDSNTSSLKFKASSLCNVLSFSESGTNARSLPERTHAQYCSHGKSWCSVFPLGSMSHTFCPWLYSGEVLVDMTPNAARVTLPRWCSFDVLRCVNLSACQVWTVTCAYLPPLLPHKGHYRCVLLFGLQYICTRTTLKRCPPAVNSLIENTYLRFSNLQITYPTYHICLVWRIYLPELSIVWFKLSISLLSCIFSSHSKTNFMLLHTCVNTYT